MGKWDDVETVRKALPEGVDVKLPLPEKFHTGMSWYFIDAELGEFKTNLRGLIEAGKSTHPTRRINARIETLKNLPAEVKAESRRKAIANTDQAKARENYKKAMLEKYGVDNPMKTKEMREKLSKENPMYNQESKEKLVATCMERYGVTNGGASPQALDKYKRSARELELEEWIKSLGVKMDTRPTTLPFQIDIKTETGLWIEHNGLRWHSEYGSKGPEAHLKKTLGALEHDSRLVHIWDYEWKHKQKQVKNFLKSRLNKNQNIVDITDCTIGDISFEQADKFMDEYHLTAELDFNKAVGIFYKGELIEVYTLKRNPDIRICTLVQTKTKDDFTVKGSLKWMTEFLLDKNVELVTTVDRRLSEGDEFLGAGWELAETTPPDYFYFHTRSDFPISKENEQTEQMFKVWDCGKKIFKVR